MRKLIEKSSHNFHASRSAAKSSRLAHRQKTSRRIFHTTKRSILTVIISAMLVVILAVLLSTFSSPERVVKSKIESIATDYYENYFYPEITTDNSTPLSQIMSRYEKPGFAKVTLRQLLLFDNGRYNSAATTLTKYCDENATFIQIFPTSPFSKTDYRIDYHYSCTF